MGTLITTYKGLSIQLNKDGLFYTLVDNEMIFESKTLEAIKQKINDNEKLKFFKEMPGILKVYTYFGDDDDQYERIKISSVDDKGCFWILKSNGNRAKVNVIYVDSSKNWKIIEKMKVIKRKLANLKKEDSKLFSGLEEIDIEKLRAERETDNVKDCK